MVSKKKKKEIRPCNLPTLPATLPSTRDPALYPQNLNPTPSSLCPHCMAGDQLQNRVPASSMLTPFSTPLSHRVNRERIKNTMMHAWGEGMRMSYGSGLLMWHVFCDDNGMPETQIAPAEQPLLSAFVAHLSAVYSGKTIANYLNRV